MLHPVAPREPRRSSTPPTLVAGEERRSLTESDDSELVAWARSGERAAFETLLRRHYDRIHRIAWRMTGSRHDAEDIAQDVCIALVGRIAGFKGEAAFTTWLYGIVVNACRDHHRRRATLVRLKDGLAILVGLGPQPDGRDLFRRTWLASELARLDPSLRETIVLVVGEGLTHAEAGAALGLAETTISWRLHEARRLLKDSGGADHGA